MEFLRELIKVSEKAANIARLCRQDEHLFQLLIQQKGDEESNPRFIEDFKTLADVLIQELVKHYIGCKFPVVADHIKGEENNHFSNKLGDTIDVAVQDNEEQTASMLEIVLNGDKHAANLLALEVHRIVTLEDVKTIIPTEEFDLNLNSIGIWIDPIDSTAEYINGVDRKDDNSEIYLSGLKCATVLIGVYDRSSDDPIIGVLNQPFLEQIESGWRGHCIWGICLPAFARASIPTPSALTNVICLSGSEEDKVKEKLRNEGFNLVEAAGAGYKILTVISGLADAYVLSKGSTYKWDTCGPQAILKALGGNIASYEEARRQDVVYLKYPDCDGTLIEDKLNKNANKGGIIAYRSSDILKRITTSLSN